MLIIKKEVLFQLNWVPRYNLYVLKIINLYYLIIPTKIIGASNAKRRKEIKFINSLKSNKKRVIINSKRTKKKCLMRLGKFIINKMFKNTLLKMVLLFF